MQILLTAFCGAIIGFASVSILINKGAIYIDAVPTSDQTGFYPLFPLMGLAIIFMGLFMFKSQLDKLHEEADVEAKITGYQTAFIIRCAFLEGAALMNIVGFMLSANAIFLALPAIAVAIMILTRPTKQSVIDALNLSYPDTEKL